MYISLSYSAGCLRFLRGGMTGEISCSDRDFLNQSASKARSGALVSAKPFDQFWHAAQVMGLSGQKAEIGNVSKPSVNAKILVVTPPRDWPMAWL